MQTRQIPLEEIGEPVDLVAVQADDELINALASGMTVSAPGHSGYGTDDRVAAILAAWKADVDVEPIPELVDTDTAVAVVMAARRPPGRRARRLAPVAAAAAFVVLAIGAVSVGSYNAQPDDALWGVSKVLYSQRAQSVEAAVRVEARITKAKQALVAGQPVVAAQELAQARSDLSSVRPEEGKDELTQVQEFLTAKAAETPPGTPTDPGTPLSTQPSRPVPPGAAVERPPYSGRTDPTHPASVTESPSSTPAPVQGGPEPSWNQSTPGGPTPPAEEGPWRDPRLHHRPGGHGPDGHGGVDPRRQPAPTGPESGTAPGSPAAGTPTPQAPPPSRNPEPSTNPRPTTGLQTPPATAEGSPGGGSSVPPPVHNSGGGQPTSTQSMGRTHGAGHGVGERRGVGHHREGREGHTGARAAGPASETPTSTIV